MIQKTTMILLLLTALHAQETPFMKSVDIQEIQIKDIPECERFKVLINRLQIRSITMPKYNAHYNLIGTLNEYFQNRNKVFICKDGQRLKIKNSNVIELKTVKQ